MEAILQKSYLINAVERSLRDTEMRFKANRWFTLMQAHEIKLARQKPGCLGPIGLRAWAPHIPDRQPMPSVFPGSSIDRFPRSSDLEGGAVGGVNRRVGAADRIWGTWVLVSHVIKVPADSGTAGTDCGAGQFIAWASWRPARVTPSVLAGAPRKGTGAFSWSGAAVLSRLSAGGVPLSRLVRSSSPWWP